MNSANLPRFSWFLVLVSLAALIVFLVLSSLTRGVFNPVVMIIQLTPLALTVPGLYQKKSRSFQWLCFLVMFFLIQGILLAFTPGWLIAGILETLICVILFFSAIIFIRASRKVH